MENSGYDTIVDTVTDKASDTNVAAGGNSQETPAADIKVQETPAVADGETDQSNTVTVLSPEEAEAMARIDAKKAYLARLDAFQKSYLRLVIAVFVGALGGVAVAIHANLWLGIGIAVFSATVYTYLSSNDCRRLLGIVYKNQNGRIIVEQAVLRHGDSVVIPDRLIWADVTELSDRAFVASRNATLSRVYIPKSIKRMGEELFGEQEKAVTILYEGSAREWESIEKRTELSGCTVIFNTEFPRLPKKVKKQSKARLSADSKGAGR